MVDNSKFESESLKLDNKIHDLIGQFTSILPRPIRKTPLFQGFQEHLMYVIMAFLGEENTGSSPQELFIQIPISKYANLDNIYGDRLQQETFQKINGTIDTCLLISTIESIMNKASISDESLDKMSSWNGTDNADKLDTAFYCEIDDDFNVLEFRRWKRNRPRRDAIYTYSPIVVGTFWGYKTNILNRVHSQDFKRLRNALRLKRNVLYNKQRIVNEVEKLKRIEISKNVIKQYASAALVHVGRYEPKNENALLKSAYFDLVPIFNSIDNLSSSLGRREMMDVIIVVGDERYKNRRQSYRHCASQKIIYIGTESPADDIPVYSFSLREMHRYCSSDGTRFEEPHMVRNISFPWMDEALGNLVKFLDDLSEDDDNFTNDAKRAIIRNLRTRFSNIDFCHDSWEQQKDNIEFNIDCNPDTMDSIKEWCEKLNYPENSNPKVEVIRQLAIQPTLVFGKYWGKHLRYDDLIEMYVRDRSVVHSYKTDFKTLANIHNHIVLDSASFCNGLNEAPIYKAYMHLMKYHLFAHVTALYYTCEDNYAKALLYYLNKEFDCYNSEKRRTYDTSISRELIADSSFVLPEEEFIFTLEDFMDANDSSNAWNDWDCNQIMVTFRDGHQDRIDGDVLINSGGEYQRVKILSLEDEDFDQSHVNIIYYRNPDQFGRYMMAFLNFPEGNDINHYEQMWKYALRDYVSKGNRQSLVEQVSSKTNIAQETIKRYLNENCLNKFLGSRREMRKLCEFLSSEGYNLSEDLIVAAKNANDSNKKNGKKLKKEVFDYKMNLNNGVSMINVISQRLNLSVDDIVNSCLLSGEISSIEII